MDCFNHDCPFRENKTSSCNRCDCIACPNRRTIPYSISSNRTLTNEELVELKRIKEGDDNPKYIEHETLKKKINDAQAEKDKFPFNSLYEIGYHNGLTMALTLAMQSPAADVAQVRHGRWIEHKHFNHEHYIDSTYECSECNIEEPLPSDCCPNCGARMATE